MNQDLGSSENLSTSQISVSSLLSKYLRAESVRHNQRSPPVPVQHALLMKLPSHVSTLSIPDFFFQLWRKIIKGKPSHVRQCHYNITGIFLDSKRLSLATSCLSYRADSNTDIEHSAGSLPVNLAGRCDVTGALPQVCEILTGFLPTFPKAVRQNLWWTAWCEAETSKGEIPSLVTPCYTHELSATLPCAVVHIAVCL